MTNGARAMVQSFVLNARALLSPLGRLNTAFSPSRGPSWQSLLGYICLGGACYGAIMGSFGGILGERFLQVVFPAAKVPILLIGTFVLTVPSLFVLSSLFGLRSDFPEALRALVSVQAVLSIVLASLAPYTAVWYASSSVYHAATVFNAAMFATAIFAAQWSLRSRFRAMIRRNPKHRYLLSAWFVVYAFVGMQMGWLLRPFIGDPSLPTTFFRREAWDNAYVILARLVWGLITG
jgi:hypothetical protein